MPSVASEGVRLAVEVIGEGRPVTLVGHGLTGSKSDFALLAPLLPGTKVLFDFRGHGASERPPPGSYSMDHFASDIDNAARAFGATCLVGVSLGGGATLRLLSSRPDRFEKLVFILPARLERSDEARTKLLRLADLLEARPVEEVAEIILAEEEEAGSFDGYSGARDIRMRSILGMNRDGIPHAIRECIDDPPVRDAAAIARIGAPALVIGQEGDAVHSATVARELAEELPNGELILYPDRLAILADLGSLTQRVARFLVA